jgi:hypothetical protein
MLFLLAGRHMPLVGSGAYAGGGEFSLRVAEQVVRELRPGVRNAGALEEGAVQVWGLPARKDETLILSATSPTFAPRLRVFNAQGVELAGDQSLMRLRVEDEGALSIWVYGDGAGEYSLRAFPGD